MSYSALSFNTDFGTVNADSSEVFNFTVPGAGEFGWVAIGWDFDMYSGILDAGLIAQPIISAVDTVRIVLTNPTAGNIVVGTHDLTIRVTMEGG